VYLTGYFVDTLTFGSTTLVDNGGEDLFVASLTSGGTPRWAEGFGGFSNDRGHDIAVDKPGNVYVAGYLHGTVSFGETELRSRGSSDLLVFSLDSAGLVRWAQGFGGTALDMGHGIATDGDGQVYVVGEFRETVDFDGQALASQGTNDVFVARLASDGTPDWAASLGGTSNDKANAVAIDGNEIFVVGEFFGTASFGTVVLTSEGASDIFLTRFSPDGTPGQTKAFGGPASDQGHCIAVSDRGIHLTGSFRDTVDLGQPAPLTASHGFDILSLQLAR
jgi:hypothetical protein